MSDSNSDFTPNMSIDELLAGIPEEPLHYEDIPEWTPVGREWGGPLWEAEEQEPERED